MKILTILSCLLLAVPVAAQEKEKEEKKEYDCSHVRKLAQEWYDQQPNKHAMTLKGSECLSTNAVKLFIFYEKVPSKVYDEKSFNKVKKHVISDIEADVVCWPEYNPPLDVTCFVDEVRVIKVHSVTPKEGNAKEKNE
jgi:hypothetical protein